MAAIMFSFDQQTSANQQKAALSKVRSWSTIAAAGPIDEDATEPTIARMCFAEVMDGGNSQEIAQRLRDLPGVTHVEPPSERKLID